MSKKKVKKQKTRKTAKQRLKCFFKVLLIIILVIAILFGIATVANIFSVKSNSEFIQNSIKTVSFNEQLKPKTDADGNFYFTTDRDFRVMQLTDVHLGGGFLSTGKDNKALNAVAAMITAERPDLVVVTGDIAFPVPYAGGTVNNKRPAILFASLMEKLGVYWCLTYGNHDTEAYSFFTREQISEIYTNREKYPHCLFSTGPDDVDGCGNYVINVKNSKDKIVQSLFMIDSHSYTDNDYFGIMWKYDCVHENQINWYKKQLENLATDNNGITPNSLMFMHIPVIEYRNAYEEYKQNGFKDTENVKFVEGVLGEKKQMIYSSQYNNGLFDTVCELGSTKAMFFGHDHLNNMTLNYKGIDLVYSYSIDYLAYIGIKNYGSQRGCTLITIDTNGNYRCEKSNYYQDKYQPVNPKETVTMAEYNAKD